MFSSGSSLYGLDHGIIETFFLANLAIVRFVRSLASSSPLALRADLTVKRPFTLLTQCRVENSAGLQTLAVEPYASTRTACSLSDSCADRHWMCLSWPSGQLHQAYAWKISYTFNVLPKQLSSSALTLSPLSSLTTGNACHQIDKQNRAYKR